MRRDVSCGEGVAPTCRLLLLLFLFKSRLRPTVNTPRLLQRERRKLYTIPSLMVEKLKLFPVTGCCSLACWLAATRVLLILFRCRVQVYYYYGDGVRERYLFLGQSLLEVWRINNKRLYGVGVMDWK